jgi:uncharacterized membrane protein
VAFTTAPLYVATILLLLVAGADWLSNKGYFRYIGSALLVILGGAVLANLRLIPTSMPLYDGIFSFVAPIAIFFLLLDVKLKDLRKAGPLMLVLFLLGSACTVAGTLTGYYLVAPQSYGIEKAYAVAGMFAATYIGGSVNLTAVALHYGVTRDGTFFAALNAADNIITTIWIIATLALPALLQRWFPRKTATVSAAQPGAVADAREEPKQQSVMFDIAVLLALATGSLFAAQLVSGFLPALPSILTLTTVALILAQLPFVQRLHGARVLGSLTVLLFLAVIGAHCDIRALIANGSVALMLLAWVTIAVGLHGLLLFLIGGVFKQDWAMIAVASNANVGGATTAGVLATSVGRDDLRLPGVLVGAVGNAIGTYIGILLAEMLR